MFTEYFLKIKKRLDKKTLKYVKTFLYIYAWPTGHWVAATCEGRLSIRYQSAAVAQSNRYDPAVSSLGSTHSRTPHLQWVILLCRQCLQTEEAKCIELTTETNNVTETWLCKNLWRYCCKFTTCIETKTIGKCNAEKKVVCAYFAILSISRSRKALHPVNPSVYPVHTTYNQKFVENLVKTWPCGNEWLREQIWVQTVKDKSHWERNVKIVFRAYLREKYRSILHIIVKYVSPAETHWFCDIVGFLKINFCEQLKNWALFF